VSAISNRWWLIPVCLVLGGVIAWISRYLSRNAARTLAAEERREKIVSQLARGEPIQSVVALLARSLEESFSRIQCRIHLAGPVYSLETLPGEKNRGSMFPIVDTKGSLLGTLTVHPAIAELTREENEAVNEVRLLAAMIAEQQSVYSELQILAKQDRLTGLMNASLFDETLRGLIETALPETTLALFVFHLDSAKRIYESLGHDAGDSYLQQAAERIETCFRAGDSVARRGDQDFVALSPGLSAAEAERVCRSVVDAFDAPFNVEGLMIASCVRIGVTAFPRGGRSPAELSLSVQAALSDAKKGVGSRFTISSNEIRERARSIANADRLIQQALDHNHFHLFYQPQLMLNGDLAGMEALVVRRPEEQHISAKEVSHIGERTERLSIETGAWIIPEAMRQYAEWLGEDLSPVPIAVKYSQLKLSYVEIFDQILSYLKTFGLSPDAIQIELPDDALALSEGTSLAMLHQLRSAGISVVLDVRAQEHSSLQSLSGLPVDAIKLNRSCVDILAERDDSMPLISATIASARALRMIVKAEGADTEDRMWLLRRLGCEVLQGAHMGRPLNAMDAGNLLGVRLKTRKCRN
jgi:diguanylate cyclase (GGDEF)-like protein